jgi:ABC-2 type transport system ATP-binding protein
MRRRTVQQALAAAALVGTALLQVPASAASAAERDGFVTSFDGTKIVYAFFPAPALKAGEKAPTVMMGPGYGSAHAKANDTAVVALRAAGYNVLTWDPRGFGDSGGNVETDSPLFEGRDAQKLIDRIAVQPEARLDAPGDPRLGMIGASYGGGIQLVLAALDKRVDVIAPQIAWHSLISSLDKSGVVKGGWGSILYGIGAGMSTTAGLQGGPAGPQVGRMQDPATLAATQDGLTTGHFTAAEQAYFGSRGPDALLSRIHIPVLLSQGTNDTLFTLKEAIQNYAALKKTGVPVKMIWFCGGLTDPSVAHGVCNTSLGKDPAIVLHQSLQWLDRYLKGNRTVDTGPAFRWLSDTGVVHAAPDYPVRTGAPLTGHGAGTLVVPSGDTSGALIEAQKAASALAVHLTKPAVGTELLGEPTFTMTYSGTAATTDGVAYAQLVDDVSGLVLGNQVTPVPVKLDGASHTITLPLEAVAIDAVKGSSYTLQVIGGTTDYFAARQPFAMTVAKVTVSIPTVARGR